MRREEVAKKQDGFGPYSMIWPDQPHQSFVFAISKADLKIGPCKGILRQRREVSTIPDGGH
jgi:hypothetical protein